MEFGFKRYHPVVDLVFFISVFVFGMLFRHPLTLLFGFSAAFGYYIRLCGKNAVKTFLLFLLPTLVFVTGVNGLTARYGATPVFCFSNGTVFTLEALLYGFVLGLSAVTLMLWFFCYSQVVSTDRFLFIFGRVFPSAALVFCMALRFVPLYKNRLTLITQSQNGFFTPNQKKGLLAKIKNAGGVLSVLFTWSLENAIQTSDSMRARGYGAKGSVKYGKFRFRSFDLFALLFLSLTDGLLTAAAVKNELYCSFTPLTVIHPERGAAPLLSIERIHITVYPISAWGVIALCAFAALCFFPLFADFKEEFKWNKIK